MKLRGLSPIKKNSNGSPSKTHKQSIDEMDSTVQASPDKLKEKALKDKKDKFESEMKKINMQMT